MFNGNFADINIASQDIAACLKYLSIFLSFYLFVILFILTCYYLFFLSADGCNGIILLIINVTEEQPLNYSLLLPTLLIAAGSASFVCVIYTVQADYKNVVNKLFFAVGISMVLWSLGLAIQAAGADSSVRFIGSRIAPLGYSTVFVFLLHYLIILTGYKKLVNKWWKCLLLYLPGIVSITGLTILPLTGMYTDAFIRTSLGWVNVTTNIWITYYYLYYTTYFIFIILLLWNYKNKASTENDRKKARLIMMSIWLAICIGSITDVGLVLLNIRIPSLGPVFSIIPLMAISYSAKRYGFMQPEAINPNEIILDRSTRVRVYRLTGICFIVGSMLNILSQSIFYKEEALPSTSLFSILLLIIGITIVLLGKLNVNELFKELLFAVLFSLIVPLITLRFVVYSSITIWVFFFMLLMISHLFNKLILLVTVLLSAFTTQLLVWSITPQAIVTIDSADYMIRLGLICLIGILALHVNKIYQSRLKDNADHSYRQTLISEISHGLISVEKDNFDDKINDLLSQCGKFIGASRAYFILSDSLKSDVVYFYEWLDEGVSSKRSVCLSSIDKFYPLMLKQFEAKSILVINDTGALPSRLTSLRESLAEMEMLGFTLLPLITSGTPLGFISFGTPCANKDWTPDSLAFLSIISNTATDAVVKLEDMRKIEWAAYHDQLTELPNRLLFKDKLKNAVEYAKNTNCSVAVAFIDLDSFKFINDTMGHETGDLLLREVSKTISACVGIHDTVARFGGDEFVLLLENSSADSLVNIIRKLLDKIQEPVVLHGQEFFVSGSIGISMYPEDGTDAETLIKNADIAMYEAKRAGKNQYVMCSQKIKNKALDNAKFVNLLYRALEHNQLSVYYQPQISLETGRIAGLEALLRWNLPDYGTVSPSTFIPIAEQTGLIKSIGEWVLSTACEQCKKWQDMGIPSLRIAVNISVQQFENKEFVQQVADILNRTQLSPEFLELEVTESVANSDGTDMVELMSSLKNLGISISIDDFGTEYSSLERLKRLPIDRIKMDMQFVRGIESSSKDRAIAQVIISLAKSLGIKVIAEGVETNAQLDFLSQRMCDEVQGFYYYKPMSTEEFEKTFLFCPEFGNESIKQFLEINSILYKSRS